MRTQKLVAEYLAAHGWPFAESTGAARQGSDITGTPDLDHGASDAARFRTLMTTVSVTFAASASCFLRAAGER